MRQYFLVLCAAMAFLASCGQARKGGTSAVDDNAAGQEPVAEAVESEPQDYQQYIDFALPGTDGKMIGVSDIVAKNRLTLVDFWASWCGPCRAEMPYVAKAYSAFHGQGLEILGVSLDNDRDDWIDAIRELQLLWPQISDLKGWDCEGARLYGVQSIPSNVLIDQQGRIVAANLRGDDLYNKVEALLK